MSELGALLPVAMSPHYPSSPRADVCLVTRPPFAAPDPLDHNGMTPLCDACNLGLAKVAVALLNGGANIDFAMPPSVRGKAMQVDPLTPKLKALGSRRLKLKYGKLLSNFAFNFNLRRYTAYLASPRSCSPRHGTTQRS